MTYIEVCILLIILYMITHPVFISGFILVAGSYLTYKAVNFSYQRLSRITQILH